MRSFRMAAITLSVCLASVALLDATTIFSLKHGKRIVLAADGLILAFGSTVGGVPSSICKIHVGPRVAITATGSTGWISEAGRPMYDFYDVAKRIATRASGVYDAMNLLMAETAEANGVLPYRVKASMPGLYASMLERSAHGVDHGSIAVFLLVGIQGNDVMMATLSLDFELPTRPLPSAHMIARQTVNYCPPACPEDGVPLVPGHRNGIDAPLPRARLSAANDLPKLAADLLEAETAASPAIVGPPFVIVEVTPKGIVWLQRPGIGH